MLQKLAFQRQAAAKLVQAILSPALVVPHGPCLPMQKTLPATPLQDLLRFAQVGQTHAAMLQMHPNGHF